MSETTSTLNQVTNELRDAHGKHRYEDAGMEIVLSIRNEFLPTMDTNDGGEILSALTALCDRVWADATAPSHEVIRAEAISRAAHFGQVEESTGDDYMRHIERVVALVDGDEAKAVAWLHDVWEDTSISGPAMLAAGISERVVDAVRLLTRIPAETYTRYILHIQYAASNPLARLVKIADLRDHLRPNCPERLRPRYEAALAVLTDDGNQQS